VNETFAGDFCAVTKPLSALRLIPLSHAPMDTSIAHLTTDTLGSIFVEAATDMQHAY
jgi:hypothetical protein